MHGAIALPDPKKAISANSADTVKMLTGASLSTLAAIVFG